MELRISAAELSRAISLMQGVVHKKNGMPILSHILLEASIEKEGGILTLSATDLEIGVRTKRLCEVIAAGSVTLPARALSDIVRELPGPDISLKRTTNNNVDVKSGRTRARLMGLSAEEFPTLPQYQNAKLFSVDATLFLDAIEKTLFAASQDETRFSINGVFLEPGNEDTSTFVATDGHRLVRLERNLGGSAKNLTKTPVTLSRKGLSEVRRVFSAENSSGIPSGTSASSGKMLDIGFFENHSVFQQGNTTLGMRVIEGQFPDYRQVIPKLSDKVVRIARQDFIAGLKRVSVLSQDKMQAVKLSLTRDQLVISCSNPEAGEVSDDVPVEYAGQPIEVAFNVRYLIEALSSLSDNNVLLKLMDSLSPGLLLGVDEPRHLCVVMPMRF